MRQTHALITISIIGLLLSTPVYYSIDIDYSINELDNNEKNIRFSGTDCSSEIRYIGQPIHVNSINGNESNPGTESCPLLTINSAVNNSTSGDTIIIHSGIYHEEIIYTGISDLTIKAADGERVVIDGTVSISDDLNKTWSEPVNGIQQVELNIDAWQLFLDYKEEVPARWPNANFNDGSVFNRSNNWAHGTMTPNGNEYSNGELIDSGPVDGGHSGLNNSGINPIGAIAVLNVGSFKTWSRIVNTYDSDNSKFTFSPVSGWKEKHHAYFLEGKLELIDVDGEWFFDSSSKILHYMAPEGKNANNLDLRVKIQAYSFDFSNSHNITLQGLEFFGTTFKFYDCTNCSVTETTLLYPSTSKRGLGIAGENSDERWVSRMDRCKNCLIDSSAFLYTDGAAIEMHGAELQNNNNTINNTYFYHIDWSVSDLPGLMTTIYMGGRDNNFHNSTIHLTGASATISIGDAPSVMHSRINNTGLLQTDGAVVQMMMLEQQSSNIAYNWIYDTEKYGIRMDGPSSFSENNGRNASVHHNVLWDIKGGIMMKGDYHSATNNTIFGLEIQDYNHLIVLHEDGWGNENSTIASNAADSIASHRRYDNSSYPIPGTSDLQFNNWNGYDSQNLGADVYSQLLNPDQFDFRPIIDSEVDLMRAGAYSSSDIEPWTAGIDWDFQYPNPHIKGCMDSSATNYNFFAIFPETNCNYSEVILGCMDSSATNYDSAATQDDNSCIYSEIEGCMDSSATNYDSAATQDDNSCIYSEIEGCMDSTATNYNQNANINSSDCSYEDSNELSGCLDPNASNYNPLATIDDNSCDYSAPQVDANCPPGKYQYNPSILDCREAAPGYFVNETNSTQQTQCPPGNYQSNPGQTECIPADPGHYVETSGQFSQTPCPQGSFQGDGGMDSCTEAMPGHHVPDEGALSQTTCKPGNYQPDEGQQECLPASPGNFVNSSGSPSQMPCEPGTYQPEEETTSCQQADPGHYVPESGSISQKACPSGSTQEESGQYECIKEPSLILLILTYATPIIFIGIMAILYISNREKKQPKTRKRSYIYSEDVRSRR